MTDLQKLRDRIFVEIQEQQLEKDLIIYELACLVPRTKLEKYVADMESQRGPRCQVKGCDNLKSGRVHSIDYCFEHHPNSIHEPNCPDDGPCSCGQKLSAQNGSPGYDHAAGYHD